MSANEKERKAIYLIKKGKKGIWRAIFSRVGIILLMLVAQALILLGVLNWFRELVPHILGGTVLLTLVMVVFLLNSTIDPTAKITWLVFILVLPVFGALLFAYTQSDVGHRTLKARFAQINGQIRDKLPQKEETWEALYRQDPGAAALARYIRRSGCYPVFEGTQVTYFPLGEDKFAEMLRQLEQARHFIFMEYFIVDEGRMWGEILEILARKAAQGVEVRVMYDGTCEFSTLPHDYPKRLKDLGIQCKMFSPVTPFISTHYNYRDHRKILVIDGQVAFNGGVNLADEYINHIVRYGHWKDTALMLKGEAARSFTLMFLEMWAMDERETEFDRYLQFPALPAELAPGRETGGELGAEDTAEAGAETEAKANAETEAKANADADTKADAKAKGFVLPYGDCPVDSDKVGERVYMDILNRAQRYVHIMSPYLILDGEMETALKFAAERGVEVALILPGIPDKKMPYALAKTHYASLLESGVKIWEYTPGFVHAKVFVSDDREAVVGTINLDYRSLYHHFECATYLYGVDCIPRIEADYQNTLAKCRQVTRESVKKEKLSVKLTGSLAKLIAPLL